MAVPANATGMYVCGLCKAEFARADYLIRHVRSHTRQRPFVCSVCAKGFGRQDLLKRHLSTHVTRGGKDDDPTAHSLPGPRHGHRVQQACGACAAKKLKCADEKPCKRCKERNLVCDFDEGGQRPVQAVLMEISAPDSLLVSGSEIVESQDEGNSPDLDGNFLTQNIDHLVNDLSPSVVQPPLTLSTSQQQPLCHDILAATLSLPPMGNSIQYDNTDPFLNDLDFSFLNDLGPSRLPSPPPVDRVLDPAPQQSAMSAGAAAYKHSTALSAWDPSREESYDREQQDLVLTQNHMEPSPSDAVPSRDNAVTQKQELFHTTRDCILAMILRHTTEAASNRIVTCFPAGDILRHLIHHALTHMRERQIGNFIHFPSFQLNKQRPELLGAIIAYGSVASPSPAVRRFGYALQETIRVAINQLVRTDYATLRELGVAQAFYIQSYLGYYSGMNSKIELTEANSMLGATMLRRGKRFRADQYQPPETFITPTTTSLTQNWLTWAEQESCKRLVYFALILDFHVGPARNLNALFSCHEVGTPLPSSSTLWNAPRATDWLQVMKEDRALKAQKPLPLYQVMRQPHLLTACQELIDDKLAAVIYLAGCLSLITEYWHMNGLTHGLQSTDDFVLKSRHAELSSLLEQFSGEQVDSSKHGPEVQLLQEWTFLHLNVSFDEVSRYCGSGSDQDAQASAPYVQHWYQSPQSRAAVWHAGQIFRAAKGLSSGNLVDVYVIALYQSGVVLWVWSLLRKLQPLVSGPSTSKVVLDGEETQDVVRFLKTGRCAPHLTNKSGEVVSIDDSAVVPELAKGIIQTNWDKEAMPLTTYEAYRFMEDFASVTRQRFFSDST